MGTTASQLGVMKETTLKGAGAPKNPPVRGTKKKKSFAKALFGSKVKRDAR